MPDDSSSQNDIECQELLAAQLEEVQAQSHCALRNEQIIQISAELRERSAVLRAQSRRARSNAQRCGVLNVEVRLAQEISHRLKAGKIIAR